MQSQTIALFQTVQDKQLSSKTILVVDEAGMVSSKQMEFLLKTAEKNFSKVLLIGDTQQLKSVEAGRPFAQLQAHGMVTAGMSEIQRQKNQKLKRAVELAAKGEVKQSIALLQKSILEINHPEDRYSEMAKDYVSLPQNERDQTLIVSGTNEARKAINQKVREGLNLLGKGYEIETLERKNLTKAQIKQISSYRMGDVIQTERNYSSLGLKKRDLCKIHNIRNSYIVLQKPDGSFTKWKPHQKNKVSVHHLQKKEVTSGELIRITQNDRQKGLTNGDRVKIIGVDKNKTVHLQREDGKTFKLDGTKPLHFDYGYCSTVHSAQGRTCERILIEADTKSLTSAKDNYYVAISRARHEVKIYTNDREKLPEAMSRENVKETALEISRNELGNKEIQNLNHNMNQMTQVHQPKNLVKEMELSR
jgi:ATP-dependent exoDNAse (exonuclease V) alpha subunit